MNKRISEIEARVKAATPGPWRVVSYSRVVADYGHVADSQVTSPFCIPDAAFIAHSREDIPYLLDRLKRADEVIHTAELAMGHAQALGYFGEGSTKGMIDDALEASRDFLKENGE